MATFIASSLLRRTLRLPLPSPLPCRHHQPLFFSFLVSTRRPVLPRRLGRPSSLFSLRLASIKVAQVDDVSLRRSLLDYCFLSPPPANGLFAGKSLQNHLQKQPTSLALSPHSIQLELKLLLLSFLLLHLLSADAETLTPSPERARPPLPAAPQPSRFTTFRYKIHSKIGSLNSTRGGAIRQELAKLKKQPATV